MNLWGQTGPEMKDLYSKHFSREIFKLPEPSPDDLKIYKSPWGTAGQGVRSPHSPDLNSWLTKRKKIGADLIVEPYLDKVMDLSLQIFPQGFSQTSQFEIRQFRVGKRFEYCGTHLNTQWSLLPENLRRFIFKERIFNQMEQMAREVRQRLSERGYLGPLGIDGLIYRVKDSNDFAFHPLVEINPRWTMGHVALGIEKRLAHLKPHKFLILSLGDYHRRVTESGEDKIFPLTDPQVAKHQVAVVLHKTQIEMDVGRN